MQIQQTPVAQLNPYPRNSRKHSDEQIDRIKASIHEFGFTNPVLIDAQSTIIAGHARVEAAKRLSLQTVPTITLDQLTPEQVKSYVIADNRLAELSEWDDDLLRLELEEIRFEGGDLELIGFEDYFNETTASDDDFETPSEFDSISTRVVEGDIICIGEHRLVCGDSTRPEHVDLCLNGAKPFLMITDPPYGVEYDANWRNEALREDGLPSNGRAVGKVSNDNLADWSETWSLSPVSVAYVYHAGKFAGVVQKSLEDNQFIIRSQIIWAKSNFAISRGDYHWKHEPCWYAVKKGATADWIGDRKQTTVWEIGKPSASETGHSTQKPVECMSRAIANHNGDVYDPFLGSGTTMVAAHQLNRVCYGIELNPKYCQIIIDRMVALDPTLVITINGQSHGSENNNHPESPH
jgi:DNA modification methylase